MIHLFIFHSIPILGVFCDKTIDIQPPHLDFNHLINEKYIGGQYPKLFKHCIWPFLIELIIIGALKF